MYQALYRKWRPLRFDEVIGQPHITKTLKVQSATGRLSHAYLFYGPRGTGKTTCARILAKAANCKHPVNGDPCNSCASCNAINDASITDVIEMDAATYTGVDDIRALRDEALYSPTELSRKVYIIDEVHMLSTNAFNAFLKILEEPPAHIMFILASTEIHKIPATILSRCQRFEFRRIGRTDIAQRLMEISRAENIALENSGASLIAHIADGAMRNALSLLEQSAAQGHDKLDGDTVAAALGLAGAKPLLDICGAIAAHDGAAAIERFSSLYASGVEPAAFCDQLLCLMRDIMLLRENADLALLGNGYTREDLKPFFASMSLRENHKAVIALRDCLTDMGRSANMRIDLEMCLLSLCNPALGSESREASIEERLSAIEERINTNAGNGAEALPAQGKRLAPKPGGENAPVKDERRGEERAPVKDERRGEERAPVKDERRGEERAPVKDERRGEEMPPVKDERRGEERAPVKDERHGEEKPLKEIKYRKELIASLREHVDMVTLSHLKLCTFLEADGKIVIKTENPMTYEIISRKDVLDAVAGIAGKLVDTQLRAQALRDCTQNESVPDGLDELFKFAQENPDIARLK